MKVVIDENLPPKLARALAELFRGEHQIVHVRDRFGSGTTDLEWIGQLSREGSWVVISADRRIGRVRAEYDAFRRSRLVGFFLSKGLAKSKLTKQMERLMALWDRIESLSQSVQGGAMFELPMKSTRVEQLRANGS